MPNYRRIKYGRTYFFTVVTHQRKPILCLDESRMFLRKALLESQNRHPFTIKAWVLLPDHIHCIWELPENDHDYSMRWGYLKKTFTQQIRKTGGAEFKRLVGTAHPTMSRKRHREEVIWQRRFWEHMIRDDEDYRRHCDYIHFNPVKHGLVNFPTDWPYSTLHGFIRQGVYSKSWGTGKVEILGGIGGE